jgi:hypothetical protein
MIGGYTYRHMDSWEGFMNYIVEIGSGSMIYIPSFIKIGSTIQKLVRGNTQRHRQHGDHLSLLFFFQTKEGRLKNCSYFREFVL